ncbi:MAG: DOMON-like domain-containing protein [Acinetobacter populi]|jgi:hypothetical protein|uniref:DOMON-like domain-containing protein n=1 Tax=Acinetobacter populi TaxID=1582270 RepID=UPI00235629AC|nr:DOMON-like domain-containing protein [Acinetobacter populi]MCH4248254.1 DOMON-like domain-containing protein [Acinetobacter populi]
MATFDLISFEPTHDIQLIGAIETPGTGIIQVGFWVNDPNQLIIWDDKVAGFPRRDYLWEKTCFELFIGVKDQDIYREINLSSSNAWQAYQFEEYRYPESMPPHTANDIELVDLQRTKFGMTATLDINPFLYQQQLKSRDIYLGLSAVILTAKQQHLFAMQHSGRQADFHNKRDWLHQL